jgi:hypothetical protein
LERTRRPGFAWLAALVLPALLVTAVACGGDDDGDTANGAETPDNGNGNSSNGSGDPGGSGAWEGELETGVKVSVGMWVPASDPDLADVEAYREDTGAAPVLYARVTATNDTEAVDRGRFLTLTDGEGDLFGESRIEVGFLCSQMHSWWGEAENNTDLVDGYNAMVGERCGGNYLGGPDLPPGETVTYYVALEGDEPEFERMFAGLGNELTR